MRFEGRRILLTGGSGSLGQLIAAEMAGAGALVTILDRATPALPRTDYLRADLSSPEGIDAAAGEVAGVAWDLLINLAGVQSFAPIEAQSASSLYATYLINLVAPARLAQAVIPGMKARGAGRIVNIGSIFGSIAFAHFASYSSSKAGLRALSQALRRELAGTGVAVTYIAPRAIRTPLNTEAVLRFAELTGMNMDEPDRVAHRIVQAIGAGRDEAYFGFPESLFVRVNAILPGLVDQALRANDIKARALFTPAE
jgi:short-subunit dehydrogenase